MNKDKHEILPYAELKAGFIRGIEHDSNKQVRILKHKKWLAKKEQDRLKANIRRLNNSKLLKSKEFNLKGYNLSSIVRKKTNQVLNKDGMFIKCVFNSCNGTMRKNIKNKKHIYICNVNPIHIKY